MPRILKQLTSYLQEKKEGSEPPADAPVKQPLGRLVSLDQPGLVLHLLQIDALYRASCVERQAGEDSSETCAVDTVLPCCHHVNQISLVISTDAKPPGLLVKTSTKT